jgi:exodeoxyribonuclease V alpha subunit
MAESHRPAMKRISAKPDSNPIIGNPVADHSTVPPDGTPASRTLSGTIERVTYHNAENGFAVLRVKAKGRKEPATVVGRAASVVAGERIEAAGQWVADPQRGLQFKADTIATTPPASAAGIERYLASGLVRGIGPETAKKLVAAFGRDTLRILDSEPEKLDGIAGLSAERARLIKEGWAAQQGPARRARLSH